MLCVYSITGKARTMTRSLNYFVKIFMFAQLMLLLLAAIAVNASEYRDMELNDAAVSVTDSSVRATELPAGNGCLDVFDSAVLHD